MMHQLSRMTLAATLVAGLTVGLTTASHAALMDNLQLHYNFDNASGTNVPDESGNSRDGTLIDVGDGSGGFSSDTPSAISSTQSLSLTRGPDTDTNNDGAWVDSGWAGVTGSTNRTVAGWIKTSLDADQAIVSWGNSEEDGEKITFRLDEFGDSGDFGIRTEVGGGGVNGGTKVDTGEWVHVAMVLDGTKVEDIKLFVNGTAETLTGANSTVINTAGSSTVGIGIRAGEKRISGAESDFFEGNIDDLGIWDRALSDAEISQLSSQAIPEPATLALLGLGGAVMLGGRKRS